MTTSAIVFVEFHKNYEMDRDVNFDESTLPVYSLVCVRSRNRPSLLSKYKYLPIFTIVTPGSTFFHDLFDQSSDFSELFSI